MHENEELLVDKVTCIPEPEQDSPVEPQTENTVEISF